MKVIFISFSNFEVIDSGSRVRPYKIYSAFKEKNYEVLLIAGNMNERRKKFLEYKEKGMFANVDYCYIEPSTYPVHPKDYLIFKYIHKLNIPIGLFYRDMHYKFPKLFKRVGFKKFQLLLRYHLDWKVFKKISKVIFFPTQAMASYFDFNNKVALPPAGEIKDIELNRLNNKVIYVGGISERYGTGILLEALRIVNNTYRYIELNLVCRDVNEIIFKDYSDEKWLNIIHASGSQLKKIYSESDMAVIPLKRNEYNDLAISVKLYEYMSYNLPIVSTDCIEMGKFVGENNIGIVVNDNAQSIANAIVFMYENPIEMKKYSKNMKESLVNDNLWIHRIKKIEQHLLKN